jgi:hypothetical protein
LAELNGRPCYFFTHDWKTDNYVPVSEEEADDSGFWTAFDIPNPNEVIGKSYRDSDGTYRAYNELHSKHDLSSRPDDRSDPKLIQVVEELGGEHRKGASGKCAELKIIEIPDGVDYEIDEYDGVETVHEVHQSWS